MTDAAVGDNRSAQEMIREAAGQLAEAARPECVLLFGSHAEGTAGPHSDADLLVVARTADRLRLAARLYLLWHQLRRSTPGLPPADILVYTPRQYRDSLVVGFPAWEATRRGVVLYGQLPESGQPLVS